MMDVGLIVIGGGGIEVVVKTKANGFSVQELLLA